MSKLQRQVGFLLAMVLTAAVAVPASAGQSTPGSGMLFIGDNEGSVHNNVFFDVDYPYPHMQTRAGDAVLGVGYGVVNWAAGVCTAGQQARLAKWDNALDDYEKLGTWGGGGWFKEIGRGARGLVRYDTDTYVLLNCHYVTENANASRPPAVLQIEYYDDWFTTPPYTDDQYLDALNFDSMYLVRAAPRPGPGVQWGPRPQETFLTPPGPCDWSWTGCGTVGKLQFADTYTLGPSYAWNNDPDVNPTYDYITFSEFRNYKSVDDNHAPGSVGALYKDSRAVSGQARDYFLDSSALELVAFYGESENVLYLTQYAARIYKMTGVKNLGWRRRAGQAAPGTRLGDGTYITEPPEWFFPVYVGGSTYATDASGGGPVIGDAYQVDPNDPNSDWVGTAITSVELFNVDPNSPLDPVVSDRHYTGLAVDAGGRVYAVSERIVDPNGIEPRPKYQGTRGDVWNGAPGAYGPNRIETYRTVGDPNITDPNNPNWRHYELFGDPRTTNVVVGDIVQLTSTDSGTSLPAQFLNVPYTILAIDPNGQYAKLDGDCGDSGGNFEVNYTVFPPGVSPIPHPVTNPFTSQALIDVYLPDGTLDATIDLNVLTRPDGLSLGAYRYDGGTIQGVIIHGDVEIDPALVYVSDPNDPGYDPNWPMDPLGEDVTRLWIYCVGGDGDPDTDDGLDLLVVDLNIAPDGSVAGASFVGGTDDRDIDLGMFQCYTPLSQGFLPWGHWIAFSELEFDGASNLVAVGGRGANDNRYAGMTAGQVREAVARMCDEADPGSPNFGDAIVAVDAFNLDMNIYGFKTAFGMAFDNTPLQNVGSPYPLPTPELIDSEPDADGTLPKTQNNVILLTFDGPISLPSGSALQIVRLADSTDVSAGFVYTVEPDGVTLKATESGSVLTDQTWYRITPGAELYVAAFSLDVCTLRGDASGNGRVTTTDYGWVKARLSEFTDARYDLNGSGRVTTADYTVVKDHINHRAPAKP